MTHRLTHHAKLRRKQMGVTEAQIEQVLTDPEITYTQSDYEPGHRVFQRGTLAVVVGCHDEVVTVLWRDPEEWDRKARP